ncbi:MAG: hypothetical protein AUK60_00435 [Rhodobacteraceae bacterium CG2_30_10_405]|nr:hypothetical protein [Rhodobacterales bacterium]NCO16022.1 hypothetical protein [Alphaproteobacteria bacterium]OIQ07470.1 MAG: hypothetical protein AUK60_00435 [Rhodobacteraceae bacterium CG2_30_10_405]
MNETDRMARLTSAVDVARQAYRALALHPELPSDRELARSGEYRSLLHAGALIRTFGSRAMFLATRTRLYADDPALSARAARDLERLWAGLAEWPVAEPPHTLH